MTHTPKYLMLAAAVSLHLTASVPAHAEPGARSGRVGATALQKVTRLAVSDWRGDRGFRQRMQREMSRMGFRFVDYANAQATVSARTWWKSGGFASEMWIRDLKGRTLWHGRAYRPRSSGYMASDQLAASLRAALRR